MIDGLIIWCLPILFQLYCGDQCTYPCFQGILFNSTQHNIFSKPPAAFPHSHVQTMDSGDAGMNLVTMNKYHQSLERKLANPVVKPVTSPYSVKR